MGRGCSRGIACLLVGRASATVFFFFFFDGCMDTQVCFLVNLYFGKCIDRNSAQNHGHYLEADCLQHLPH
jgi:hypothetical protein